MKLLIGILVLAWLGCGAFGASRLHDMSFKKIIRGPITLAKALNEDPVRYPGSN